MGPKQKKITASTPAVGNPSATFGGTSDNSGPSTIHEDSFVIGNVVQVALKQPVIPKITTWDLICKAIEIVGVPKKGASYLAIRKWIINNKENVKINRLKANLKKAIVKALESGLLKRPAVSKNVIGLKGYFILVKEVNVRKPTATKTAKGLLGKTKAFEIPKTNTATVPKPKAAVKSKSNKEEATRAKPKATVVKTKSAEEATSAKPKAKVVKTKSAEEATIAKAKVVKTKSAEATSAKPKAKVVKTKSAEEATSAKSKAKVVKTKSDKEPTRAKAKVVKTKSAEEATSAKSKTKVAKTKSQEGTTSAKLKTKAVKSISDTKEATNAKPKL